MAPGDSGSMADGDMADGGPMPMDGGSTCMPVDPLCQDEQITMLDLFATANTADPVEEGTMPGVFVTHVDATAGGFMPSQSYVYARFTDTGLVRADLSDQDAFASSDWDIAFRRFVIRLNSGVSGPSCVTGARTAPGTTFDSLTSVPATLDFHSEVYMTADTCDIVPDGSGLGSPSTVLSSYWTYPMGTGGMGCVSMTHNVYVISLASGRHVKLEVLDYYEPAAQMMCDGPMHTLPSPSGSGNIRIQWSFLD